MTPIARAKLLLPYTRMELPGWGRLLAAAGPSEEAWASAPVRVIRGKWHGYTMRLDLSDRFERYTYFCGRYYELAVQLLLMQLLRPGHCFVDVGANRGMLTLLAARLVGSEGSVLAFEPNPRMFERLAATVEENGLEHVTCREAALGERSEELVLRVPVENSGRATLTALDGSAPEQVVEHRVRVDRGDDAIQIQSGSPATIKIDVEGFEERVLRGLGQTLQERRPAVITEAINRHLARDGSSVQQLSRLMRSYGYTALAIGARRQRLRYRLDLLDLEDPSAGETSEILWLPEESPYREALRRSIRTALAGD